MQKPFLEIAVVRADGCNKVAMQHDLMRPDYRANLATSLVMSFSHIGIPDGETSTGEARQRPQTPRELADRVVTTTELLIAAFEERGWLVAGPALSSLTEDDGRSTGFR